MELRAHSIPPEQIVSSPRAVGDQVIWRGPVRLPVAFCSENA
jgi:hypothetical protein